jgi:hypothetical protein
MDTRHVDGVLLRGSSGASGLQSSAQRFLQHAHPASRAAGTSVPRPIRNRSTGESPFYRRVSSTRESQFYRSVTVLYASHRSTGESPFYMRVTVLQASHSSTGEWPKPQQTKPKTHRIGGPPAPLRRLEKSLILFEYSSLLRRRLVVIDVSKELPAPIFRV